METETDREPDRGAVRDGRPKQLPAGRQAELATFVIDAGQVTVSELADRFGVSSDTVRRDLDQLDADGVLIRTHGGAVSAASRPRPDPALSIRQRLHTDEKEAIGKAAARLVQDDFIVMINAGTTTLALARHLRDHRGLTIATNNLLLPSEISPDVFRDLYMFGGSVRAVTQATTGPVRFHSGADGARTDVRADLALIAVGAVSVDGISYTSNLGDAVMMAEMMQRSARVAVLADSSKFGRRLFAQVAEAADIDYLVTDQLPPDELARTLKRDGVQVVLPKE